MRLFLVTNEQRNIDEISFRIIGAAQMRQVRVKRDCSIVPPKFRDEVYHCYPESIHGI
jgi:hypothetical protein